MFMNLVDACGAYSRSKSIEYFLENNTLDNKLYNKFIITDNLKIILRNLVISYTNKCVLV